MTRGRVIGDVPLTDEYIKLNSTYSSISEFARALAGGDTKLREIPGLKPVLRLHPPRKGYKTTKRTFLQGGALGYYGQEINTLLYKMR
jgi:large subunit ribosomal protein L30